MAVLLLIIIIILLFIIICVRKRKTAVEETWPVTREGSKETGSDFLAKNQTALI